MGLPIKENLQQLYYGDSQRSWRFRVCLLSFDCLTILFFVASSMLEPNVWIYGVDYLIAVIVLSDSVARAALEPERRRLLWRLDTWIDSIVVMSLLATMFINNLSFLRILRTLRLLRSYHVVRDLSQRYLWFRERQDIIKSAFNLFVFIFFITACVYVLEGRINPEINNYFDALYFTVTTLTTTGFGDITMTDSRGRMLAIIIMVVGVSLFLRLVQTLFRPTKVLCPCPDCGLQRHDPDAVHCKHCGRVLNIRAEGY